ncbi:MAG: bifunctional UDP-N-acetylmuramoyl-tripeptide:D-alanyl-D-alanine ligase/alanine racemase [Bacteroidales bacterium]|nr:bifunctional UDP-N-acetylmuramoyl-tripeptide:D-alanyl-D-alanine ligase/alanine racemase [Bacteroidales bacterium]
MQFEKGYIYHIYNHGNNYRKIFYNKDNYLYFLKKIRQFILPYADILAWCLMPNHFHLMILVNELELPVPQNSSDDLKSSDESKKRNFTESIAIMLRSYTRGVNKQQKLSGSLFRAHTKIECVNCPLGNTPGFIIERGISLINNSKKDYPKICFDYIHEKPVTAGLVKNAYDWVFSSARDYAGLRNGQLVNKELGNKYQIIDSKNKHTDKNQIQFLLNTPTIIIDSRSLVLKDNVLFAAIKGERNDGHNYILELYNKGVHKFLIEYIPENAKKIKDAQFIIVENTLKTLQKWAAKHRKSFNYPVVGITGSNGKTIVKEWIFQVLNNDLKIIRNPKSYNSQIGVPISVLLMKKDYDLAVFEAGISQYGEMQNLEKMITPKIGIFTNIGDAHQENFKNTEDKIHEKLKLFSHSGLLIYCKDHNLIHKAVQKTINPKKLKTFTWSKKQTADLKIHEICKKEKQTKITFSHKDSLSSITIPFTDKASLENAIHVLAFLLSQNLFSNKKAQRFAGLNPVAMRLEIVQGINNCTVINDTYNSDLNSIQIALDVLNRQNQHKNKSLIISDVLQTAQNEKELYEQLAEMINKAPLDELILVGEKLFKYRNFFKGKIQNYIHTEELLHSKQLKKFQNQAILLKAARKFRFDRINEVLQQKQHRTVLEINMENMQHNLNYYRSLLKKETQIMIMVKAFSYGSGSYEIASWLAHQKVDYLGVAYVDEGIALRTAGISLPIMVMNPNLESFPQLIEYKLEPEIYNFTSLNKFEQTAQKYSVNPYPVHIKIDTGMHRLGFDLSETDQLIEKLKHCKSVQIKSVFSHLVASDEAIHDKFTLKQIKEFKQACKKIQEVIPYKFSRHILNSSGIERFPEAQFEMVRLGIGLYGISPNNQSKLKNVSTLKTHISQIKKVKAGETVGYSRAARLKNDTRIAILPIGYADGLNRKLSNGVGKVFINGDFAPFIGNICMDMSMIELNNILANEDDEVIIFGEQLPVNQLAKLIGTIPYEVFTSISSRVKRVYLQ